MAGQSSYDTLQAFYCRNARAAVICFDLCNRASFESVPKWVKKVREGADPDCVLVLVGGLRARHARSPLAHARAGTKADLVSRDAAPGKRQPRAVSGADAHKLARSLGALYFETSALLDLQVADVFNRCAAPLSLSSLPLSLTARARASHARRQTR